MENKSIRKTSSSMFKRTSKGTQSSYRNSSSSSRNATSKSKPASVSIKKSTSRSARFPTHSSARIASSRETFVKNTRNTNKDAPRVPTVKSYIRTNAQKRAEPSINSALKITLKLKRKFRTSTAPKQTESSEFSFPARINRYLAHKGFSTRRGADDLIEKGLVKINDTIAKIGDQVTESDTVIVNDSVLAKAAMRHRYIAYHKPIGVSTDVQHDSRSIASELPALRGLYPLGRLDKDSHGLILLTNDGRLTERLLHPSREHEKEYLVRVDKRITDTFIRHIERGILIETYKTKPAKARRAGDTIFYITLTEGKKHQIRRMCAAEGYQVVELTRIRIMNVKLGDLISGSYRDIAGEELMAFLRKIGL